MSHFQFIFLNILMVLFIFLAAFFSCAETALMAVNRYRLRHKARLKKRSAMRLLQLLKRPDRLLGAILIGSTFTTMMASSLVTLVASQLWGEKGALLAAIGMIFVVLIFAEITPKTLAALYADKMAAWVVYPVQFFLTLLYPAVWLANWIANNILRLLHVSVHPSSVEPLSREELRSIVYETAGKISRQYQNMLLSILDLSKLTVDDVMVQRQEIESIDVDQPWEKIIDRIQHARHEWVPVHRGNINQIIGIIYLRDMLRLLLTQNKVDKQFLLQHLQEPYFVPEGTPLSVQLGYFQQSHHKNAFVVDEYGEIQGLLTLDDILEEIVGDFTSSLLAEKRIQQQSDGSFLVDGAVTVREFNRTAEEELPLRGPRTINGLIIEYLESLPYAGTCVLIAGYPIEIIQVKDNRVKQARIFPRLTNMKMNNVE